MRKTMIKTIGVLTLFLFVMTMTGTAATCTPAKANPDKFTLSSSKNCFQVLSNDKGTGITVVGISKCQNGGKVTLRSNGYLCYKPASSSKTTISDSFIYKIKDKCGGYSFARVTITYKNIQDNDATVIDVTKLSQINTSLTKGPVFLKIGADWCHYCVQIKPSVQQLAKEYDGKITVMSLDVDNSPKLADYFGAEGIPDCCVIVGTKDGKYVYMQQNGKTTTDRSKARLLGYKSKEVFEKIINIALKK